jgi:glutaminyl-tRNA synthetase
VDGWDDPRLPTIFGMRRRGVTPEAIRTFCRDVGVTRSESRVEISHLEHAIRDDLNTKAPRVMAVLDPLKVTVTNVDADHVEWLDAPHWPREIDQHKTRPVPFTRELYIERDDFRRDPPDDFHRLAPGREVRLMSGYFFTCEEVVKGDDGAVEELRGTIDPETRSGTAPDGRSPAGTIHWVSATHGVPFEARLYERLFDVPVPDGGPEPFTDHLNPESLIVRHGVLEPAIRDLATDQRVQFVRQGYFWPDPEDDTPDARVFNQIVPLRDTWAEAEDEARRKELERKKREKERQKEKQRQRSIENKRDPVELLSPDQRERFKHYHETLGVAREDAAILAGDDGVAGFFEDVLATYDAPQPVANWVVNELLAALKDRTVAQLPFDADAFGRLVRLVDEEAISSRAARDVFGTMMTDGGNPESIVDERGLRQIDDREALAGVVADVVDANPDEAERYRDGAQNLIGFFMGQVMQKTQGTANPELARELLQEKLSG